MHRRASRVIPRGLDATRWLATRRWTTNGISERHRYVLHDRDTKFCAEFRETLGSRGCEVPATPSTQPEFECFRASAGCARSKAKCLSKLILFGEGSLRRALKKFQSIITAKAITKVRRTFCYSLVPKMAKTREPSIECRERLGGLFNYYHRRAA